MIYWSLVPSSVNVHLRRGQRVSAWLNRKVHSSTTSQGFQHWCKATPYIKHTTPPPNLQPCSYQNQLSWLSLTNRTVCCPPLDAISTERFSSCLPVIFTGVHSSSSKPVPSCMLVPIPQEYTEPGIKTQIAKCTSNTFRTLSQLSALWCLVPETCLEGDKDGARSHGGRIWRQWGVGHNREMLPEPFVTPQRADIQKCVLTPPLIWYRTCKARLVLS